MALTNCQRAKEGSNTFTSSLPLFYLDTSDPSIHKFRQECARSSGAVHSVFLIDVYLDLENPGGSGFWVGENRRVTGGTGRVSLQAPENRGGRILTQRRVPSK
jgi:hypothetical protein